MKNTIVEEIHKRRVARAEAFGHDLDAMIEDIRRKEAISRSQGAKFVTPRKRRKAQVR
jgi:hypothetical protein